jgi:type VI protein secretion system component VasF
MALFIRQNEDRSKLQERLAAELREKAKARSQVDTAPPDGVTDMNYLKDTKTTTSLAWVWIVIILFALAALVVYIVGSAG